MIRVAHLRGKRTCLFRLFARRRVLGPHLITGLTLNLMWSSDLDPLSSKIRLESVSGNAYEI